MALATVRCPRAHSHIDFYDVSALVEFLQLIGKSTISSMLSGAINGAVGEIKSFITTYQRQYNELKIVLTGGDANLFEIELKNGIFADPNLVLKGLNEILIYNRD